MMCIRHTSPLPRNRTVEFLVRDILVLLIQFCQSIVPLCIHATPYAEGIQLMIPEYPSSNCLLYNNFFTTSNKMTHSTVGMGNNALILRENAYY